MTDTTLGSELHRFAAVNDLSLEIAGAECLDVDYDQKGDTINEDLGVNGNCVNAVRMLQQTNYTDPASRVPGDVGNRQWFYQTCTQFGWYQSSDQTGGRFRYTQTPSNASLTAIANLLDPSMG